MSRRDPDIHLRHMLDHAREALALVADKDQATFQSDRLVQLALVRLLEVVGDAAARVPQTIKDQYDDIAWGQIVG